MHLSRRFYRTPYSRDDPGLQHQVFCCSSITLHSSISNPHINHSHCYCFSIPLDTNYFPTVSSCDFKTNYSCPVNRLKFSIFSLKKRKQIAIPKLGRFSICEIFISLHLTRYSVAYKELTQDPLYEASHQKNLFSKIKCGNNTVQEIQKLFCLVI